MTAKAIVRVGVGDPLSDAAAAVTDPLRTLQLTLANLGVALPNDPAIASTITYAQTISTAFSNYVAEANRELAACKAALATQPAAAPPQPTSNSVSTAAAGFIAVGSALVGGVAGYAVRGKMKR